MPWTIWGEAQVDGQPTPWRAFPWGNKGELERGYVNGAHYLFHIASRTEQAGLSWVEAQATILRGAASGRHGISPEGAAIVPGLHGEMRTVLGEEWDPVKSVLTYILGQAVDDLTENNDLQNRDFLLAGGNTLAGVNDSLGLGVQGWMGTSRAIGIDAERGCHNPQKICSPALSVEHTTMAGSVGTIRIDDVDLNAYILNEGSRKLAWMIVRIR